MKIIRAAAVAVKLGKILFEAFLSDFFSFFFSASSRWISAWITRADFFQLIFRVAFMHMQGRVRMHLCMRYSRISRGNKRKQRCRTCRLSACVARKLRDDNLSISQNNLAAELYSLLFVVFKRATTFSIVRYTRIFRFAYINFRKNVTDVTSEPIALLRYIALLRSDEWYTCD